MIKSIISISYSILILSTLLILQSCGNKGTSDTAQKTNESGVAKTQYPSDIIPMIGECKILLGDGKTSNNLIGYSDKDFFYTQNDGDTDWVVYKTPNSGVTSKTSSNTRTELHHKKEWLPLDGGKLNGTLKVMHVSTSGDARVGASYSVVIGQIHSGEGHKNEPLKIFYKKFPGHEAGSVFWNYEINTAGDDNAGRWDYSTTVWGHDMSVVGPSPTEYPAEPKNGVKLGEVFSYEINVYKGTMYLTFEREGQAPVTFTKNLMKSDFSEKSLTPKQTQELFWPIGQDGVERPEAYADELNFFKQGAYNQTNGKDPEKNIVWCGGAETYGGDIPKQYANGSYTEVWFSKASTGAGTAPK